MFRISLLFMLCATAAAQTQAPVGRQIMPERGWPRLFPPDIAAPPAGRQIMAGDCTLQSGISIRVRTVATPQGIDWSILAGGAMASEANTIHRVTIDKRRATYFGYDLLVGSGDAASGYLVTFQPLSSTAGLMSRVSANLIRAPEPRFPPPQVLHDGDVIELDLMVSPDGTQRVTDYIEFLAPRPAPSAAELRDFTLDDGPVTFHAEGIAVWVDGKRAYGIGFTGKPGATFWIAFPNQGRYILSLVPHEGFVKAGAVRDNAMQFQDGDRSYELRFSAPVAGAGKAWNLYLLHDPAYTPNPAQRLFINAGTDRLEKLLPKR